MSHLVRWDAKKGASFVHALRLDLDKETTSRVGHAYGIIVADVTARQGDALSAHLEDAFTRGAAEAVQRLSGEAPQDQLFEAAIARTNLALGRLFGEHGLGFDAEHVSAAVVALKGHDLVAATWGAPSMLLFHPMPNGGTRIIDMVDETVPEPSPYRTQASRRCFGSIIAGRMGKRDRLLISSQDLRHFLGEDALAGSVVEREPEEATAILNQLLAPRAENSSMALLVLDVTEIRYVEHDPSVAARRASNSAKTQASIAKLLQTASDTGETLAPSLIGGLSKKVAGLLRRDEPEEVTVEEEEPQDTAPAALPEPKPIPRAAAPTQAVAQTAPLAPAPAAAQPSAEADQPRRMSQKDFMASLIPELPASLRAHQPEPASKPEPEPAPAPVATMPEFPPYDEFDDDVRTMPAAYTASNNRRDDGDKTVVGTVFALIGALIVGAAKVSFKVLRAVGSFLLAMFGKESRTAKFKEVRAAIDHAFTTVINGFNNLNALGKGAIFCLLLLSLAAKVGLMAAASKQAELDLIADYENQLTAITQKIDSADASAIYHDESRASSLLTEAQTAIDALPAATPEQNAHKEELAKRIAATRGTLRREVQLGQPQILASIATMGGNATLAKMTSGEGSLWLASADGQIFRVPTSGGEATKAGDVAGGTAPAVLIPDGKDVFASNAAGAGVLLTAAGTSSALPVNFGDGETAPTDADYYSGRLYVLDATHNRITRHMEQTGGFDAAQHYMKDGTDLSGSVSLAIDGVVWVLKRDGSVIRIEKGLRENFSNGQADPPVTAAVRLRTTADSDLFVLDTAPSRIVRYDKNNGSVVAQYVSPELNGATDFTIDEKGTTAYVTKGNQVLQFALPTP